jgi:hypothetical protein
VAPTVYFHYLNGGGGLFEKRRLFRLEFAISPIEKPINQAKKRELFQNLKGLFNSCYAPAPIKSQISEIVCIRSITANSSVEVDGGTASDVPGNPSKHVLTLNQAKPKTGKENLSQKEPETLVNNRSGENSAVTVTGGLFNQCVFLDQTNYPVLCANFTQKSRVNGVFH